MTDAATVPRGEEHALLDWLQDNETLLWSLSVVSVAVSNATPTAVSPTAATHCTSASRRPGHLIGSDSHGKRAGR